MADWKKYSLSELVEIKYGRSQKKVVSDTGTIPIYGTGGLMGYATEALYDKPSVLIGRKGSIGNVKYVEHPFWTVDTLFYTIVNTEIVLPKFLYYVMSQIDLNNYNEGTTIPSLRTETLYRLEFDIPSLDMQETILSYLNPIDEKIVENEKINNNLEQQGAALFKKMFIDKCNNNWKYGTLANLGTVVGGSTPSKAKEEYYTDNGIAWITPKDLSGNHTKFISHGANDITELGLKNSSASIMPRGTVLFSSRAPIGYVAIAKNDVTTNQGFKSVIPNDNIGTAYIYYLLKHSIPALESVAIGSTFKEVSGAIMKNFEVIIPDQETLTGFNSFCETLFYQQEMLEQENQYLENLRNMLLPQLLSGKVDCSNVPI